MCMASHNNLRPRTKRFAVSCLILLIIFREMHTFNKREGKRTEIASMTYTKMLDTLYAENQRKLHIEEISNSISLSVGSIYAAE